MKKRLSAVTTMTLAFLANPAAVFAREDELNISLQKPENGGVSPTANVGKVISNAISIIFVVGLLAVLFMLIIGAFNWITSGGDKEAVGKARQRIINALIGLMILAVAFLLAKIAGQVVNVDILNLKIPSLDKGAT